MAQLKVIADKMIAVVMRKSALECGMHAKYHFIDEMRGLHDWNGLYFQRLRFNTLISFINSV